MAYQPNIPTGTVPLNQDYANVQGNFSSLNTQWLVDHVPLTDTSGTPPNGYHTFVHLVPFSVPNPPGNPNNQPVVAPAATVGYGQLFGATINDGINTDTALYYLSGGGRLSQLTRNIQPLSAGPGYSYLPGGILIQWGETNNGGNFPITFNTLFSVTATPVAAVNFLNSIPVISSRNNVGFTMSNNGGQTFPVTWIAIGK